MLIDGAKYLWSKGQPEDIKITGSPFSYAPKQALKIYRFECEDYDGEVTILESAETEEPLYQGRLPYEPETPISCDGLVFLVDVPESDAPPEEAGEAEEIDEPGETAKEDDIKQDSETSEDTPAEDEEPVEPESIATIHLIAETGILKTVLTPYLNTAEGMDYISNGYNDDSTFSTTGLDGFMFNGTAAATMYISSNHWLGFGTGSEQLKVLRRDGCSTAIYRQSGETTNGLQFLKIRFEGYTVYNNRVEENRLIFELFLLSNNDMFLNVIQTPTSGNTGTSELICNGTATPLTLFDGQGGGTVVSFYHQDTSGKTWNVVYDLYEETDSYSKAYLMRLEDTYYTMSDGELSAVPIETLTAAMFLKYGFEELPNAELLTPLVNPQFYLWKTGGNEELLKATMKAYPYPQVLESIVDMSHISILGIKLLTAEFSGDVQVRQSIDNGGSFSEEVPLTDWLNTDPDELYASLPESKILILRFVLHDNAAISRFKITYIN